MLRDVSRQLGWQLDIGAFIGFALELPWSKVMAVPGLHTCAARRSGGALRYE